MAQAWAEKFYHSKRWKDAREYTLMRDNYMCQAEGCFHPAEEVHHIIHLTPENIDDPDISTNPDNLVSLCRACHFKQHKKIENADILPEIIFIDGRPIIK